MNWGAEKRKERKQSPKSLLRRLKERLFPPRPVAMPMCNRPLHIQQAAEGQHTHTVIFLHGRGGTGPLLAQSLAAMSASSAAGGANIFARLPSVRWVFPSAEEQAVGWFCAPSLHDPDAHPRLQLPGLRSCVRYLQQLIRAETEALGGAAGRVAIAGISQGQAAALLVLLAGGHRLGAFVGASGWLPLASRIERMADARRGLRKELELGQEPGPGLGSGPRQEEGTPVLLGHGTFDTIVDVRLGRQACRILREKKMDVTFKEYVGADLYGHWFKEPEQLHDIVDFLQSRLQIDAC